MPQTEATRRAIRRDGQICLWCFYVLGKITYTKVGHHIFGRRFYDKEELIIALCPQCHSRVHQGLISRDDLINKVVRPYIWEGRDLTPREFAK